MLSHTQWIVGYLVKVQQQHTQHYCKTSGTLLLVFLLQVFNSTQAQIVPLVDYSI